MLDMSDLQAALSCFHAFKDSEDSPACAALNLLPYDL